MYRKHRLNAASA